MVPALLDSERRFLILVALLLSCGSLSLLPLAAESSSSGEAEAAVARITSIDPVEPGTLHFPTVSLDRDPFVPLRSDAPARNNALQSDSNIGIVLPPNAGASSLPLPQSGDAAVTPAVRAVILGARSKALVDLSGEVRVLGIGDAIGISTVSSVDARGVVLSNGVRLPLLERRP